MSLKSFETMSHSQNCRLNPLVIGLTLPVNQICRNNTVTSGVVYCHFIENTNVEYLSSSHLHLYRCAGTLLLLFFFFRFLVFLSLSTKNQIKLYIIFGVFSFYTFMFENFHFLNVCYYFQYGPPPFSTRTNTRISNKPKITYQG